MSTKYPQRCCACGVAKRSRNLVMLNQKALTPGKGWGCMQCGLPSDGALAAICDDCASGDPEIRYCFDGYVTDGKMAPIAELPQIPHEHNMALHPEVEQV